jgi:hypothetical protein
LTTVALPKDALLVELRPEVLTFETRQCILPGTLVSFNLVMEGRPLRLECPTTACLVVGKDRSGYLYESRVSLADLSEADRQLIVLFIGKGRGSPTLTPAPLAKTRA